MERAKREQLTEVLVVVGSVLGFVLSLAGVVVLYVWSHDESGTAAAKIIHVAPAASAVGDSRLPPTSPALALK